jgi:LytS/YehU family sensor histidine kinase
VTLLEHAGHLVARRLDAIRLERERVARGIRDEEVHRLMAEAKLQALRAQINPHFLFNALTTIGYLVQTAPSEAVRTLLRLTEVLRHVLRSDERVAPLDQELRLVRAYLDIEQARFEERLEVDIDVPDDLLRVLVPPLILQPLVENAVKHGVSTAAAGGRVRIVARRIADAAGEPALQLDVEDTPRSAERMPVSEEGSGIALANIERRLALAYGGRASIALRSGAEGTLARVVLPLELVAPALSQRSGGVTS